MTSLKLSNTFRPEAKSSKARVALFDNLQKFYCLSRCVEPTRLRDKGPACQRTNGRPVQRWRQFPLHAQCTSEDRPFFLIFPDIRARRVPFQPDNVTNSGKR